MVNLLLASFLVFSFPPCFSPSFSLLDAEDDKLWKLSSLLAITLWNEL